MQWLPSWEVRLHLWNDHRILHRSLPCWSLWQHHWLVIISVQWALRPRPVWCSSWPDVCFMQRKLHRWLRVSRWQCVPYRPSVSRWYLQPHWCQHLHAVPSWSVWVHAWHRCGVVQWCVCGWVCLSHRQHQRHCGAVSSRHVQHDRVFVVCAVRCGQLWGCWWTDDIGVQWAVSRGSVRERDWCRVCSMQRAVRCGQVGNCRRDQQCVQW